MQVSVNEMLNSQPSQSNNAKIQYFSLVNDGDSAIVRFLHKDINDFEVLDVHNIQLGGFNRKISCLRSANEAKEECPLCSANKYDESKNTYTYPLQRRFYIHLLKYENPQTTKVMVWDRSKDYIKKLNELEQNYGPLCDRLYKIVRHGIKGSPDTTYDILPLDKDRYNPENYAFNREDLNYKKALGTVVLNKDKEEIATYLSTGNFPGFKSPHTSPRPEVKSIPTQNLTMNEGAQALSMNENVQLYAQPSYPEPRVVTTHSYEETHSQDDTYNNSFEGLRRRV